MNNTDLVQEILANYKSEEEMTEKQKAIIKAAMEIIFEKGFASSSTSEIAKKAGVAEGTIFKHFRSKDNLLFNIIAPTLVKLVNATALKEPRRIMENNEVPVEDRLEALFLDRTQFFADNWPHFKILVQEALVNPNIQSLFSHVGKGVSDFGEGVITELIAQGKFRDVSPQIAWRAAASVLLGFIFFRNMLPENAGDEETEVKALVDILMNGLANKEKRI